MFKVLIKVFVVVACLFPFLAQASLIAYGGYETISKSGQTFTWEESVLPSSGFGIFTVSSAGDYNTQGTENLSAYLDDVFSAESLGLHNADFTLTDTPNGHFWIKTYIIKPVELAMITHDHSLTVELVNSNLVNPIWETGFVSWSLTYHVPEPSSLVLLGAGLVGLGFTRKLKNYR